MAYTQPVYKTFRIFALRRSLEQRQINCNTSNYRRITNMPSIIPTSIKLADRHNGPYALRRSVNIVFLLLARQNKQVSFALARASVRRFFIG